MDWLFRSYLAVLGAVTSYLFGGWSAVLEWLAMLMVVDYFMGTYAAVVEARNGVDPKTGLNSSVGAIGIAKKVLIFAVIALAHKADIALGGLDMGAALGLTSASVLRDGTAFSFCANELISLAENAGRAGLPLPGWVKDVVAVLRSRASAGRALKK